MKEDDQYSVAGGEPMSEQLQVYFLCNQVGPKKLPPFGYIRYDGDALNLRFVALVDAQGPYAAVKLIHEYFPNAYVYQVKKGHELPHALAHYPMYGAVGNVRRAPWWRFWK